LIDIETVRKRVQV